MQRLLKGGRFDDKKRWLYYLLNCGGIRHVIFVPVPLRGIRGVLEK